MPSFWPRKRTIKFVQGFFKVHRVRGAVGNLVIIYVGLRAVTDHCGVRYGFGK